ncbi:C6 zinc finger domain protein [Moelleriella libera RCEF 2490]|uniref:C6 zinc finger domain protein n=1 Tax=Moelleriella libera RCEF 2490 TaxID=1081109 RepID=A0A166UC71_9HYPO|nr:C6 zinc finger domain protein [Moelleriella libera RCEF 2490]
MASPPPPAASLHRHLRLTTSVYNGSNGDDHHLSGPEAVSPDDDDVAAATAAAAAAAAEAGAFSAEPAGTLMSRRSGKRPAARGTAFYPRKRANTACQVCRARKTKCDNKKPSCSYCLSVGATCIQSAVDLSSFDPASLKILDRLDELERLLRTTTTTNSSTATSATAAATDDALAALSSPTTTHFSQLVHPPPPHPSGTFEYELHRPSCLSSSSYQANLRYSEDGFSEQLQLQPGKMTENGLARLANGHVEDVFLLDSVLPPKIGHILEWQIFQGSKTFDSPVYRAPPDAMSSPGGAATLAAPVDMESHGIYKLLDNFFSYIHCNNPILDEPSARKMVGRVFLDGIDWSPASCLAMIICALGCIATPFGSSRETRMGTPAYADSQAFFQAAQKRIGILLVKSDIVGAQCLFLSGIYMMMVFQPIYAWRFFSQALAACQHFPFLTKAQDLSASDAVSPVSVEMGQQDTQEQAVYWSAWKSERELRGELSLPDFDIHHSGSTLYPPFFPAPPAPPPGPLTSPDSEARRSKASWMFYLAEISLRRQTSQLCSEVLNLRQRYASNTTFLDVLADMTTEYEVQAQDWSNRLPGELSISNAIEEDDIARSVLRGKLINLYEMIYWSFVMVSLSTCGSGRVLKSRYAELAKRGLDTHMHQIRANEPGFQHRHHGCFFMIRACARSAFSLVAAAKSGMPMPLDWDEAVFKVIGMLAYWEEEDRDVAGWKQRLERELGSRHD